MAQERRAAEREERLFQEQEQERQARDRHEEERRRYIAELEDELAELQDGFTLLSRRRFGYSDNVKEWIKCPFCGAIAHHYSDSCPEITTGQERYNFIEENGMCRICLGRGHKAAECRTEEKDCWYCNTVRGRALYFLVEEQEHHRALCVIPDSKDRIRARIRRVEEELSRICFFTSPSPRGQRRIKAATPRAWASGFRFRPSLYSNIGSAISSSAAPLVNDILLSNKKAIRTIRTIRPNHTLRTLTRNNISNKSTPAISQFPRGQWNQSLKASSTFHYKFGASAITRNQSRNMSQNIANQKRLLTFYSNKLDHIVSRLREEQLEEALWDSSSVSDLKDLIRRIEEGSAAIDSVFSRVEQQLSDYALTVDSLEPKSDKEAKDYDEYAVKTELVLSAAFDLNILLQARLRSLMSQTASIQSIAEPVGPQIYRQKRYSGQQYHDATHGRSTRERKM
ncbi:hypothetical protein OSTOST_11527, partial [Ostertagia ostertagi]